MGVQTGFCEGGRKKSCPLTRVSVKRASTVLLLSSSLLLLAINSPWSSDAPRQHKGHFGTDQKNKENEIVSCL